MNQLLDKLQNFSDRLQDTENRTKKAEGTLEQVKETLMHDGALFTSLGNKVSTLDHQLGTFIALRDSDRTEKHPREEVDELRLAQITHGIAQTSKDMKFEVANVERAVQALEETQEKQNERIISIIGVRNEYREGF